MKCPKCGYLGFEEAERCRNCGHDFALNTGPRVPDLPLRDGRQAQAIGDLDLIDATAPTRPVAVSMRSPAGAPGPASVAQDGFGELPLFTDDVPLITKASPPRAPLSVRRATPEVPRLRGDLPRTPSLVFHETDLTPPDVPARPVIRPAQREAPAVGSSRTEAAGIGVRFLAAAIDLVLLALVDLAVVYFTLKVSGLADNELQLLPVGPLIAFLVVQNGGYLVAFTAGGQTIGKMLTGIKVVAAEPGTSLDLGRSFLRTFVWGLMVLPAGLGLLTALLSPERRGFHDRFAGTKVIRIVAV